MQQLVQETAASRDKLLADLKTLASDAEELIRTTASYSGEGVASARARIADSVRRVRDGAINAEHYAMDQYRMVAERADTYVRDKPWQAVGVAALIGLAIGFLGSRR
ncbi:MAG TPA: DUF883 family protein [Burkholderiaceae bacterium]|nr:DUF883 family protein [Burkholderiaceae bacterium]